MLIQRAQTALSASNSTHRLPILRSRLLGDRFHRRCTVIRAGAGFGKTTLLEQAIEQNDVNRHGIDLYFQCRPNHRFAEAFGASLNVLFGASEKSASVQTIRDWIWQRSPEPVALMLDDLHQIPKCPTSADGIQLLATGSVGETEDIDSFELRYVRQHTKSLHFALSGYYSDYSVLAWTFSLNRSTLLGDLELFGLEGELTYQGESLRVILSHNYTKHLDFELNTPIERQNISASVYGYGDDLASWSNHNTKLVVEYDLSAKWMASASLRVLWGFPGGEDLAEYNRVELGNDLRLPVTDGSDRAWGDGAFLNLGLQYQLNEKTVFRIDAHNILGLIHEDLNKRNAYQRTTAWRNEAPAISLSAKRTF